MNRHNTILLIEDEEDIQQLVSYNLVKHGYAPVCADSGEDGLRKLQPLPDLILLDIMLPGMDGLSVLKRLKEEAETALVPVIMLTARGEEEDIVAALNMGADDYIVKPFSPRVLLARVEAVIRRSRPKTASDDCPSVIEHHGLRVDAGRRLVTADNTTVELTASEFAILTTLIQRPGWVFTRQQLIDKIKGHGYVVTERLVDVQIFNLRKKLGAAGKLVETVRGIGYRFRE